MKNIRNLLITFLAGLSLLWWWAEATPLAQLGSVFPWRTVLMQYTGALAIGVMSFSMLLAVRPVLLEGRTGGLDKMYRLHKWLGISALVLAVVHWLLSNAPKWMVGWGWLQRPQRPPRSTEPLAHALQQFFLEQRGLAEGMGEWAFYGAVLLMVLALVKRFPYRQFFKTHRLLAVAYLALVWHGVVLLKFDYWGTVLGAVMALLMAAGTVAAVVVLLRRVAASRQVMGEVAAIRHHAALDVVELDIRLTGRWAGHAAGQFAFVTLHPDEGAHPFTISSAWRGDGHVQFIIKALGDYTRTLALTSRVGDVVKLEGPYGRFNFEGSQRRQIWVGGGIGITPFVARMKHLALQPDGKAVDLFHTTQVLDATAMGLLERDALAAQVQLHVLWDPRDGRLDAERLAAAVPDWKDADIWFCGPAGFGHALQRGLAALGLPAGRFHQELFEMR